MCASKCLSFSDYQRHPSEALDLCIVKSKAKPNSVPSSRRGLCGSQTAHELEPELWYFAPPRCGRAIPRYYLSFIDYRDARTIDADSLSLRHGGI
jgi:hypothetical protein